MKVELGENLILKPVEITVSLELQAVRMVDGRVEKVALQV
jgi:hypothetical protein